MAKRPGRCGGEIEFMFELEVLSGEEGRQLRLEQARAIRDLLLWVRKQRLENDCGGSDPQRLERPP